MTPFQEYINEVESYVATFDRPSLPFFRGANKSIFNLKPTLIRNLDRLNEDFTVSELENNLFYDFCSYGDGIITQKEEWDVLFKMQHYGIPTRLLDWTESFGVALYFALEFSNEIDQPCIWALDPYRLNDLEENKKRFTKLTYSSLYNPNRDFLRSYYDSFIIGYKENNESLFKLPQALYPIKSNERIRSQWGVFTIHGTMNECMSDIVPDTVVKKFVIPENSIDEARQFLKRSSINHFSMMPDFEGLKKYLKAYYYR